MILVTGAAGKTGRAVLGRLANVDEPVRAFIRRPEHAAAVFEAGAHETVVGDVRDRFTLDEALGEVRAVFHIPPNMHPDELLIGRTLIEASQQAGVERFVYHSVLQPHIESMPHHWAKMRVEEALFTSELPFTILQPAAYIQNILRQLDSIQEEGVYRTPYPVDTRLSLVDLEDVAVVAARVLTKSGHFFATYELVGTDPLSQRDVASTIGRILGTEVRAVEIMIEAWEADARERGMTGYAIDTLIKMFQCYEAHGFEGNPGVLGWLLGRQPNSLEKVVRRTLEASHAAA
jgi:uncharacterized protein YbjT (DUF2867 family)